MFQSRINTRNFKNLPNCEWTHTKILAYMHSNSVIQLILENGVEILYTATVCMTKQSKPQKACQVFWNWSQYACPELGNLMLDSPNSLNCMQAKQRSITLGTICFWVVIQLLLYVWLSQESKLLICYTGAFHSTSHTLHHFIPYCTTHHDQKASIVCYITAWKAINAASHCKKKKIIMCYHINHTHCNFPGNQ